MRAATTRSTLLRLGFTDPGRAESLLTEPVLGPVLARAEEAGAPLPEALASAADPDLALLATVRLLEACGDRHGDVATVLAADTLHRRRLVAVLGASSALGDMLVARPEDVALLAERDEVDVLDLLPEDERAKALAAVGADPTADPPVATVTGSAGVAALRRHYRRRLLEVAAADLTSPDPFAALPKVAAALADLAGAALDAALAVARADLPDGARGVRLAVLGMGKTGGRELNYVSDVDVVYVVAPAREDVTEGAAVTVGTRLAAALARACSGAGGEPALWPVDANLRPEGKDGPLVRTLASHRAYYERWARTWEFQALLKARPVAGDAALGAEYVAALAPLVWSAAERENFVEDSQAMRRRVEDNIRPADAERELKLGRGGLRDVEFTVQLLQLVHGRTDERIRSGTTLTALASLAEAGYVGRDPAARMDVCYRFLRVLEHRIQLFRLRRTHVVPTDEADLRRLGRAIGHDGISGADSLEKRWLATRRHVRRLHEEIFYRPLLPAAARLAPEDLSLAPEAARARLAAIGYRDPDGAVRHIAALSAGVSRSASIQRQLLPVMLGWFAEGPDPDGGLLAFRKLSEQMGRTHWYLGLLRDSTAAAPRLAEVLSSSRYLAEALTHLPEAVAWLADDDELCAREPAALRSQMLAVLARRDTPGPAATAIRYQRRRELVRAGIGDVLDGIHGGRDAAILTPAADVALEAALRVGVAEALRSHELAEPLSRFLVVAMGRLGGAEMSYASDADVLFVHDPLPGADEALAQQVALTVAGNVRSLLGDPGPEPAFPVDAALRPEGRNGPITRSFASYAEYYQRWAEPWERQALLRARPVAGDAELGERFVALIAPVRYPDGGLDAAALRELRRIKARVESERMPRGVPPTRHLKLGRGGLTDVEWTAQLLQLQHAFEVPELRTTTTLGALVAAREAGVLAGEDAERLCAAWTLASRIRNATVLFTGRTTGGKIDVLPGDRHELGGVARVLGYGPGEGPELEEDYLRTARRARAVVERVFFD
ncbi:bifunctional [glutamine synthetase] adenylyltransferase/[glutamine synthetase]-adenylyl-L-tyrosine phosphorylase [Georgenia faecalis]|uniref:Bifunctional glutamine synthetase adenylyltransferase/adenylyl-removing enzyme n=1 Tax=Georgenia faecalis TaxID=2483799 RepID=A0ABV9DAL6_9MICO|nr:bifunctional [glutamine synthetase] adenylyltransferase/[glutamine synthetase]-adenylyl-L-tyrosine phosphorylase [Georgenia faecalis]